MLRMGNRNDAPSAHPERNEAIFTIREPIILDGDGVAVENLFRAFEVDAMLPDVRFSLRLIPLKPHEGRV